MFYSTSVYLYCIIFLYGLGDSLRTQQQVALPAEGRPVKSEGWITRGGRKWRQRGDWPRREGAKERSDPLVQRTQPHSDSGENPSSVLMVWFALSFHREILKKKRKNLYIIHNWFRFQQQALVSFLWWKFSLLLSRINTNKLKFHFWPLV